MKVLCVLVLVLYEQLITGQDLTDTALQFGTDGYILIDQDLGPLHEALTACSWVKRMRNENIYQYWLSYGVNSNIYELGLTDMAYNYMFLDETSFTRPTETTGEWHSICFTWSYSTRTKLVYFDGKQIGTGKTPSGRKLDVQGTLLLGQLHANYGVGAINSVYYFGGELYDTNIYSSQLSASEVENMFTRGRCGNYSQTFGDKILISWQEILQENRQGSVSDVELDECDTNHTHPEEEKETESRAHHDSGKWDFLRGRNFYNKIISEDFFDDMIGRLDLIAQFTNHTIDDALILHLDKHHSDGRSRIETEEDSESESEEITGAAEDLLSFLETDNWVFLTHETLYNQVVTNRLLSDVTVRLDLVAEFIGHRCDNALIEHLEKNH